MDTASDEGLFRRVPELRCLEHMAAGALLGACFEVLVALNTLTMEGVSPTDHFAAFDLVGLMTIKTTLRKILSLGQGLVTVATGAQGFAFVAGVMVAIDTGGPVAVGRGVRVVVEEDFAGCRVEHQPDGGFWGGLREGGVTDDGNEQQVDRETIGNQQLSLGSH